MRHFSRRPLGLIDTSLPFQNSLPSRTFQSFHRFQSSSADDIPSSNRVDRPERAISNHYRLRKKLGLVSEKVPIGISSLGQPAQIVIVPPKPQEACSSHPHPTEDHQRPPLLSILDDIEKEAEALSHDMIRKRFDEYQALHQEDENLTPENWQKMRSIIASSFSTTQLSDYLIDFKKCNTTFKKNNEEWRPGISEFFHPDSGNQGSRSLTRRVASSQGLMGKLLLVERIMRDCWNWLILDEVGQQDLHLSPRLIALLMNAKHFSFDEVASLHQSSIDIFQTLGYVRITGRQIDCGAIHELILDVASRIREEEVVDIKNLASCAGLSVDFLEWLGQAYGILAGQSSPEGPMKILYLPQDKDDAESARRTLYLAIHATQAAPVPFSTYLSASQPVTVHEYKVDANGSWFDRQKTWMRWALPPFQTSSTKAPRTPLFDSHQSQLSAELLKLLRCDSAGITPASEGSLTMHESVTATVGRCAFARKATLGNSPISASQLGRLSLPRTFTTDVPRIMLFLDTLPAKDPAHMFQMHRIRLTPSLRNTHRVPELEVEFTLNPTGPFRDENSIVDIRSLKVIRDTASVDYLLPENSQDLRFTRYVYHHISVEASAESSRYQPLLESIKNPLENVFNSPFLAKRSVPLPPFCEIQLPTDLTEDFETKGFHNADLGMPTGVSEDYILAEYMFPPIADIGGAAMKYYDFEGRQLRYRSCESGPFLATTTSEVALDFDLVDSSSEAPEFHSFYKAACDVAFGIHKAYTGLDF